MVRGGFSIIEVAITVVILSMLLTLAVVSMGTAQRNARDTERKADIEALSIQLEDFYKSPKGTTESSANGGGTYPGVSHINQASIAGLSALLPDISAETLRAPGVKNDQPTSLFAATNNVQTTDGVFPRPTYSSYIYQAIGQNGTSLCLDHTIENGCRKFNLYYMTEDNTVHMITSKNQ